LALGDSVFAKVLAINFYGEGEQSNSGNGATCVLEPTKPINLQNNGLETSETQIGFSWEPGVSTGGRPVLDWTVYYDPGMDVFIELDVVIEPLREYLTTINIISGQTYKFKVIARNEVGYSPESDEISILAATIPYVPNTPVTQISD